MADLSLEVVMENCDGAVGAAALPLRGAFPWRMNGRRVRPWPNEPLFGGTWERRPLLCRPIFLLVAGTRNH